MPGEGTAARYDAVLVPRHLLRRVAEADDNGSKMAAFVRRWGALIGCGPAPGRPEGSGIPERGVTGVIVRAGEYRDHTLFVPTPPRGPEGRPPAVTLAHPLGTRLATRPRYAWEPLADGAFGGKIIDYPRDDLSDLPPPEPVAAIGRGERDEDDEPEDDAAL